MNEIVGKRYGKLVAIRPMENKEKTKWLYRCDCGKELIRSPSTMKLRKSCGCGFEKVCEECGKTFTTKRQNVLTCSNECCQKRYNRMRPQYKIGVKKKKKKKPSNSNNLGEVESQARKRGLSYGQLQAIRYMELMNNG